RGDETRARDAAVVARRADAPDRHRRAHAAAQIVHALKFVAGEDAFERHRHVLGAKAEREEAAALASLALAEHLARNAPAKVTHQRREVEMLTAFERLLDLREDQSHG